MDPLLTGRMQQNIDVMATGGEYHGRETLKAAKVQVNGTEL